MSERFFKNQRGWKPSENDYLLAFQWVEDYWREVSGNVPKYAGMIFADYLNEVGICLPEDCTFCRIQRPGESWEFRAYGGLLRVFYKLDK